LSYGGQSLEGEVKKTVKTLIPWVFDMGGKKDGSYKRNQTTKIRMGRENWGISKEEETLSESPGK